MDTAVTTRDVDVPLVDLRVSNRNARRGDSKLEDLAASILAQGLLQSPVVIDTGDGYEIVAGARRFGALQLLRKRGELPAELSVIKCRVIDAARADGASLAENVVRQAMHPADEFEAFKRLADNGDTPEEIGQAFGVTPLVVQRRMKLASVSPKLFELFRADKMSLDQIMALASSDDHAAQEAAWGTKRPNYERQPHNLRQLLLKTEISVQRDPAAKLVGVKALEQAGVVVRRDLFSDSGEGFATDRQLIDQLALDKLELTAEQVRTGEGWSWVEARIEFDWQVRNTFKVIEPEPDAARLTKADAKKLEELRSKSAELARQINDLESDPGNDEAKAEEEYERLDTDLDNVQTEINELEAKCEAFTAEQLAGAGAIVTIGHNGKPEIIRGLVRPGDKAPGVSGGASKKAKKKGEFSEKVVERITAHRTAILQGVLLKNHVVALVVIVHRLLCQLLSKRGRWFDATTSASMIDFHGPIDLTQHADELKDDGHYDAQQCAIAAIQQKLPKKPNDLFDWLLDQTSATLLQLLAYAVSQSVETTESKLHRGDKVAVPPLIAALGIDFSKYWAPTRAAFLDHVPRATIEKVVQEACGAEGVAQLKGLKKEATAATAERLLAGKGWLPSLLRAPSAKPKKKPAKKAAKKRGAK